MTTLETLLYVFNKFGIDPNTESPIRLRTFKRYDMAGMFKDLGFTKGAEIGVYRGEYSEVLCMLNPQLRLYCIDPWKVYKSDDPEPFASDQKSLDKFCQDAKKRLSKYNCKIIEDTSMNAIKNFAPESLDFVYIDANHSYKNMKEDLEGWSKIVRKGGIVSGHDYGHFKHKNLNLGTKKAIDEYVAEHKVKLFLVNRNFQTSWFFIK